MNNKRTKDGINKEERMEANEPEKRRSVGRKGYIGMNSNLITDTSM